MCQAALTSRAGGETLAMMDSQPPPAVPPPPTSAEGVDLTQIRALKRLTPAERLAALTAAANNLLRLRKNARRL